MCSFIPFGRLATGDIFARLVRGVHQKVLGWFLELSFLANIYWYFCAKCWARLLSISSLCSNLAVRRPPLLRRQISWIDRHILQVLPVALAHNLYGKKLGGYRILIPYRHQELDLMWRSEIQKLSQVVAPNLLSSSALIPREPFFWFYSTKVPKQLRNQTLHHAGMDPGLDKNLDREECQKLSLMWQSIIYETTSSSASSAFIFSSASKRGFHVVGFIKPNFQNCCAIKTSVQEWIQYLEQISKNRSAFKLLRWHVHRCLLSSPASRNLQFYSMWGSTKKHTAW